MAGTSRLPETMEHSTGEKTGAFEKAKEMATNVGQTGQDTATKAAQRTDDAVAGVGERVASFGHTLHEKGPHTGILGSATNTVADQLEAGGTYLKQHGMSGMAKDLESVIGRHPWPALLVGFWVGCLIGTLWRKG